MDFFFHVTVKTLKNKLRPNNEQKFVIDFLTFSHGLKGTHPLNLYCKILLSHRHADTVGICYLVQLLYINDNIPHAMLRFCLSRGICVKLDKRYPCLP